jgi:hypothetical protein
VIFQGRVVDATGTPVAQGMVEMVAPKGTDVAAIATGKLAQGSFSIEATPGPVWGLRINSRPVLAVVISSDGERTAGLGEIVLADAGIAWPAFHAADGRVFGLPRVPFVVTALAGGGQTTTRVETKTGLTFGAMLGSTAQQLNPVVVQRSGFRLAAANIVIKGVPTATQDAIGLDFPNAELAATGAGLSEIALSLKPQGDTTQDSGTGGAGQPTVPGVIGYTRELAVRKLTAASVPSEIHEEVTTDAAKAGRVLRQFPSAGTPIADDTVVRIFIGKK